MYKFVSNITMFQFSSAYKKPKPRALTLIHTKRSQKIHIQTQPATADKPKTINSFCASHDILSHPPPQFLPHMNTYCAVQGPANNAACQKGPVGFNLNVWPLERLLPPLQPKRSPQLDSHYTHKGAFINTTFNLLLVKTQEKTLSAYNPTHSY